MASTPGFQCLSSSFKHLSQSGGKYYSQYDGNDDDDDDDEDATKTSFLQDNKIQG